VFEICQTETTCVLIAVVDSDVHCTYMSGCGAARNSQKRVWRTLWTDWSFRTSEERTPDAEET